MEACTFGGIGSLPRVRTNRMPTETLVILIPLRLGLRMRDHQDPRTGGAIANSNLNMGPSHLIFTHITV